MLPPSERRTSQPLNYGVAGMLFCTSCQCFIHYSTPHGGIDVSSRVLQTSSTEDLFGESNSVAWIVFQFEEERLNPPFFERLYSGRPLQKRHFSPRPHVPLC